MMGPRRRLSGKNNSVKLLRFELALLMLSVVTAASLLALGITISFGDVIWQDTASQLRVFLGIALKDFLLLFNTIIFTLIIIGIVSPKATQTISSMSDATRKIASGDFSVRIEENSRNDEIGMLTHNFNIMAKELEGNELLKQDFIANISHEYKTPLAIIQGYARLLEEGELSDEERRRYASLIYEESGRLAQLSSNMLRLSRLENQEIIVAPKSFALDEQILQTILLLQPKWEKKHIEFDTSLPETCFTGDEELLSQVWLNITDNAIKYSPIEGLIKVDMLVEKGSLTVSFSDEGQGMDEETKKRAFERYYHGGSAEGNGLGLSIVKRIVELHGGSAEIDSEAGKGTTVMITLPVAAAK